MSTRRWCRKIIASTVLFEKFHWTTSWRCFASFQELNLGNCADLTSTIVYNSIFVMHEFPIKADYMLDKNYGLLSNCLMYVPYNGVKGNTHMVNLKLTERHLKQSFVVTKNNLRKRLNNKYLLVNLKPGMMHNKKKSNGNYM